MYTLVNSQYAEIRDGLVAAGFSFPGFQSLNKIDVDGSLITVGNVR